MRPLTNSEKKLLLILASLGATLATAFLLVFLINLARKIEKEITNLQNRKKEAQILLAEKELWYARQSWLQQTLQPAPPAGIANSTLLTQLQKEARPLDVQILEQRFIPTEPDARLTTAGAEITISANLKNLITWLHTIQSPDNVTGVSRILIRSEADPSKVRAEVRVVKFYLNLNNEISYK